MEESFQGDVGGEVTSCGDSRRRCATVYLAFRISFESAWGQLLMAVTLPWKTIGYQLWL